MFICDLPFSCIASIYFFFYELDQNDRILAQHEEIFCHTRHAIKLV